MRATRPRRRRPPPPPPQQQQQQQQEEEEEEPPKAKHIYCKKRICIFHPTTVPQNQKRKKEKSLQGLIDGVMIRDIRVSFFISVLVFANAKAATKAKHRGPTVEPSPRKRRDPRGAEGVKPSTAPLGARRSARVADAVANDGARGVAMVAHRAGWSTVGFLDKIWRLTRKNGPHSMVGFYWMLLIPLGFVKAGLGLQTRS